MIDTIRLTSPAIPEEVANIIEQISIITEQIDVANDHIIYSFVRTPLKGSYDRNIYFTIRRQRKVYNEILRRTITEDCPPYIELELSLQKFLVGNNIEKPIELLHEVLSHLKVKLVMLLNEICVQYKLGYINLPDMMYWQVQRIDISSNFDLGTEDIAKRYMNQIQNLHYPRRKTILYKDESISFPSSNTFIKIYRKGAEYRKNDFNKIKKFDFKEACRLYDLSKPIIRFEVEFKKKYLKKILNDNDLYVKDINIKTLYENFQNTFKTILGEGEIMRKVRNNNEVFRRLHEVYKPRLATVLFGTYCQLAINRYEENRMNMTNSTFYRHMKQLRDANVDWVGTDLREIETAQIFEFDFSKRIQVDQNELISKLAV